MQNKTGFEDTSPVGNYPLGASLYGALDMAGNGHRIGMTPITIKELLMKTRPDPLRGVTV